MKNKLFFLICLSCSFVPGVPTFATQANVYYSSTVEREAQAAFHYLCHEVELDAILTHEQQREKLQEFKNFAASLSPQVASRLISFLLEETRSRILDILLHAEIDQAEVDAYLADNEMAILNVSNMSVEIARQMLFFVAELKIHRQYVHDYGVALGCPEKQLLQHDLCKLSVNQFEGYARYFKGGRQPEDRPAYLAAWELHQHEEHHLESYSKEGFNFDTFPKERLKNNMLETVADWLAASKQREGGTLIDYLVKVFPTKNYDPRLLPDLEAALITAHDLYLKSEEDPTYYLFKDSPCWTSEVEKVFRELNEKAKKV